MTPSAPSEPSAIRSGLGPAPDPGKRRDSITPAGVGTEQAFLLYVLKGVAAASVLLAFSVGAKLTITITNVVAGFTAIALTLRTVRFRKALGPPPPEEATEG